MSPHKAGTKEAEWERGIGGEERKKIDL